MGRVYKDHIDKLHQLAPWTRKHPIHRKESWTCPPEGVLKINVNATYSEDEGCGSVGVVVRDFRCKFIADQCKALPFVAEAYAMREGLCLAQHMGCNRLVIKSDNAPVVETMREEGFSERTAAAIFHDCNILSPSFTKVTYEHCLREADSVAHEFARNCFQSSSSCT
jgi:ribonuclease HI